MPKFAKAKLTHEDIDTIVALLEVWDGPLTWERLLSRVALILGRTFTRQALDNHSKIKTAFQCRKRRLRNVIASIRAGKPNLADIPPELAAALQRADALQSRVDRLQRTVECYEIKFILWLYNARNMGLSEDVLNSELPKVDRRTDKDPTMSIR